MKYFDEYRDENLATNLTKQLVEKTKSNWTIMEVCGGQTHTILQFGLEQLLPSSIDLVHGPGCPICVTPLELIDKAIAIAQKSEVIFCSFGDMMRVPGSDSDLLTIKAKGADIRAVYSPLDCIPIAQAEPTKKIVFFAVGFETTAPANAMLAWQAKQLGLTESQFRQKVFEDSKRSFEQSKDWAIYSPQMKEMLIQRLHKEAFGQ